VHLVDISGTKYGILKAILMYYEAKSTNSKQNDCIYKLRKERTDITDGTGDSLVECLSVTNCRKIDFCVTLNAHGVSDVRQTEIHTRGLLLSCRVDGCRRVSRGV